MTEKKAFRYSAQRERILEYIKKSCNHPDADMVYRQLRSEFPAISLGTVYRNLQMLTENSLIKRISVADGPDRFDGDTEGHTHFQCYKCGKIYDVNETAVMEYPKTEHRIVSHSIIYSGICSKCLTEEGNQ